MYPLVSIMMPAYNASDYIAEAILSTQKQTYRDWQLCIVDDGSQDNTADIAQEFANSDGRIIVERQAHAGCPTARNMCLQMATGDIIARLDADDTHERIRLERQVNYLLDYDEMDIVTCEMYWLFETKKIQKPAGAMHVPSYMSGKGGGPVCASIVTWKRIYDTIGPFKTNQLAGSDGDWNFRAIIKNMRWGHLPFPWYNQRRHSQQISKRLHQQQRTVHEAARMKYYAIWKRQR